MNHTDLALARADLYVVYELTEDNDWLGRHGRHLRRRAREVRECVLIHQSAPLSMRYRGWRRYGQPRGIPFSYWSPWIRDYRTQLHLAVSRGSEFAVRQLSQALVDDVRGAA